ncbi:MAG TPA: hypothetical protein GXZ61_06060 [Clostridiales bacterium]|jgi:hypothetical protein|nr:hypothetical protein [Clostridiales bacterium]
MERWYQAAEKRCSIRSYMGAPSQSEIDSLRQFADSIALDDVRIAIARSKKVFAGRLMTPKIKGTDCFAAFISKKGRSTNVGYIGELFILECVARGFGTCWLGASFRMGAAQEVIPLQSGEVIACTTPIGFPAEPYKQRPRRTISSLTGMSVQEFMRLPQWQQDAIKCGRRAPSAINAQPWDFDVIDDNSIAVVNVSNNLGYGKLDCGIAMLHIELGAAHNGYIGDWDISDDEAIFKVHKPEIEF